MPIHDWTRVGAGIFHHFHHRWISAISDALNAGLLPDDYYALAEQHTAGFEPDVLALQGAGGEKDDKAEEPEPTASSEGGLLLLPPKMQVTDETDLQYYRRKQKAVVVRHVSGDRIVALVEIVSPGNKSSRHAMRAFVRKAAKLLNKRIHLLILDLHPPGRRDPEGIHGVIWDDLTGRRYHAPADKPRTLAAYESDLSIRAYVAHAAVGDALTDMPLFLVPEGQVPVPLEATYQSAFAAVPRRWRRVLEAPSS